MSDTNTVPATLAEAIIALHADVRTLPKDGWNKHSNYSYAKGDTVVREARALLSKHGLAWVRTGSRLKAPTLADGRLGTSKDYVGDVEIAGVIMHSSGACLHVAGETPIVVMSALPHDKSWAASITFGTGYVLLGVLNQDKDDKDDINARNDAPQKPCTEAAAAANKTLTDSLASQRDTTREALWEWACDKCGIKAGDNGLPGPGELYEAEASAVLDVLQGLMRDTKVAAPSVCSPEQANLVRRRRVAFATLRGAQISDVWAEVCKRLGVAVDEPERLSPTHAIAAATMLEKWIAKRKAEQAATGHDSGQSESGVNDSADNHDDPRGQP